MDDILEAEMMIGPDDDHIARRMDALSHMLKTVDELKDPKLRKIGVNAMEAVIKTIHPQTATLVVHEGGKEVVDKKEGLLP